MKMLKSMVVLTTVLATQSLWANLNPKATQVSTGSKVTDVQKADNTGDKTCPYAKASPVGIGDNTVASTYGTTNLRSPDYRRGTDSGHRR